MDHKDHLAQERDWAKLASRVGLPKDQITKSWLEIASSYQHADRAYHNLVHLSDMLVLSAKYRSYLEAPELLALSIWFHDLVYKVERKDNEKQSAEKAKQYLEYSRLSATAIEQVYQSILATQQHQLSSTYLDLPYLLDFDLAVLGRDEESYQRYALQIRKEYHIYPDELYQPGRKKVLQHFLARESLYFTPIGQELWEEKARVNLKMELSSL